MIELSHVALAMAGVILLLSVVLLVRSDNTMAMLTSFPRNRVAAGILTAGGLLWSAAIVYNADLGGYEWIKQWLIVVAAALFFLVFFLVDELLAARALGGILLLVATPILNVARWHPSTLRLVPVVLCYVIVVAGMALMLNPYLFRKFIERIGPSPSRWRIIGGSGIALAVTLLALALLVY